MVLSSCALVPKYSETDLAIQAEVKSMMEEKIKAAESLGYTGWNIKKYCSVPFDCSANNNFDAMLDVKDIGNDAFAACKTVLELATQLEATYWMDEMALNMYQISDPDFVPACTRMFEQIVVDDDDNTYNGSGSFQFGAAGDSELARVSWNVSAQRFSEDGKFGLWLVLFGIDESL